MDSKVILLPYIKDSIQRAVDLTTSREQRPDTSLIFSMIMNKGVEVEDLATGSSELTMEHRWFTPNAMTGGGKSSKPLNIVLNWKELMLVCCGGALGVSGSIAMPFMIPLAAILFLAAVLKLRRIDVSEIHAHTMIALWKNCDDQKCLSAEDVPDIVNAELKRIERAEIKGESIFKVLGDLEKLRSIEISGDNIFLKEKVRVDKFR